MPPSIMIKIIRIIYFDSSLIIIRRTFSSYREICYKQGKMMKFKYELRKEYSYFDSFIKDLLPFEYIDREIMGDFYCGLWRGQARRLPQHGLMDGGSGTSREDCTRWKREREEMNSKPRYDFEFTYVFH